MRNLKRTLATYLSLAMVAQLSAPALANSTPQSATEDNFSINQTSIQEQEVRVLSDTGDTEITVADGVTLYVPDSASTSVPTEVTEKQGDWTAVNTASEFGDLTSTATPYFFYLSDDVELTSTLTIPADVTVHLCLNGHTLNGNSVGSVIRVEQGSSLYLYDSVEGMQTTSTWGWSGDAYSTDSEDDTLTGGVITGGTGKAGGIATNTNGGGISSSGSVYMYGGNIAGNTATKDGGGITATNPADDGSRVFEMYGGTIIGNKAGNNGGGVNTTTDVTLYGGSIENNKAGNADVEGNTNNGGGLNITGGGTVTMEAGFEISGNEAVENGGGIFVAAAFENAGTSYAESQLTINGGTISGNSATLDGGGILNSGNLTFNDGEISENNAKNGGGVYHVSSSSDVVAFDVTNISGGSFAMTGGSITDNTASQNGGGVNNEGTFDFSGGTITENKAEDGNGGGIRNADTLTITGGVISENISDNGGGLFNGEGAVCSSETGTISTNSADFGGGVYNLGEITLSSGSISNNLSSSVSDGIYQNGKFTLNGTVNIFGNDVYLLTEKEITLKSGFDTETTPISLRVENPSDMSDYYTAFTNGATADDVNKFTYSDFRNYKVVAVSGDSNELTLEKLGEWIDLNNSSDSANITTEGNYYLSANLSLTGGLTIGDGTDAITVDLDLEGYELSTDTGSVITISSGCTLNLYDSNTAKSTNYGYWVDNGDGTSYTIVATAPTEPTEPYDTLTGGIITGGSGSKATESDSVGGGAILNLGNLNMYGGILAGNHVEGAGGAVRNNGTFTMSGGTIIGNSAQTQGGGVINIKGCTFHFSSGQIENNKALGTSEGKEGYGAGISNNGTLNMSGGSVIKNEAFSYAGGIANNYASGSGEFAFSGGLIAENNATTYGGGVNNAGTFTMSGGTIEKNSSGSNGGGVRNALTFTMSGGTISDNQATTTGGGVQNADTSNASADFNMSGGIISGNTAESKGDGIYQNGTFTLGTAIAQGDGIALVVEEAPDTTITIADNDVYLTYDSTSATSSLITIGDNFNVIGNIPVSMEKAGVFTDSTNLDHISLFTYGGDDGSYWVSQNEDGELQLIMATLTEEHITVSLTSDEGNASKFNMTEDTSVTGSPDVSYNLSYTTDGEADVFFNKNGKTDDDNGMFGTWLPLTFDFDSVIPIENLYYTVDNASANSGSCTWYKFDDTITAYWQLLQEDVDAGKGHWYTFALLDSVTDETVQKDTTDVTDFVEVRITYTYTSGSNQTLLGNNLLLGESFTLTFDEEWEMYSSLSSQDVHDKYYGDISSVELTKDMDVKEHVDFTDAKISSFDLGGNTLTVDSGVTITFPAGCGIYNGTAIELNTADGIKDIFQDSSTDTVNVTGSKTDGWVITGLMDLSDYTVNVDASADLTYTGSALTPPVTVKDGDTTLTEGTDYTVEYTDNTDVGTANVTITGTGNYKGTATAEFEITAKDFSSSAIFEAISDKTHTGTAIEPTVTVKDGVTALTEDEDYTVSYSNNTEVGTSATVTITGRGNYTGTASTTFEITATPVIEASTPSISTDLTEIEVEYTTGDSATALTVEATVTDGGNLSYQWYSNTANSTSGGIVISSATLSSYTPPTTTVGTTYYYVVVTNTLNGTTAIATSQVAKITVEAATVSVTSVKLNKNSTSLTVGGAEILTATIAPSNATNSNVTWSSSDTSVATVSSTGTVTAKGAGTATITVKTNDGNFSATCSVTVTNATVSVTSITLNKTSLDLEVGNTDTLTATIAPSTATNQNVTWKSSNESVATVLGGKITAVGAGTATITVTTADGSKTATCLITVTSATSDEDEETPEEPETPEATLFTITLNSNGGTLTTTSLTTSDEGKVSSLPTPTRSGYTFNGWYTSSTGGTEIFTSTMFEENTTIYAQWTKTTSSSSSSSSSSSGYISSSVTYPILNVANEGTASVSPNRIENGKTGTITVTPKAGYVVDTITIIDANKNKVEVIQQEDGTYKFTQPIAKVTVNVTFTKGTSTAPDTSTPDAGTTDTTTPETPSVFPEEIFHDVNTSNWYYSPVKFVLENGLMSGTGSGTFSPDGDMLRGMAVTVLYALAERPIPSQSTYYADISTSDYYYLASQWASEQDIMTGIGDDLFSPNTSMTKEQMCLVFYKYALTQTKLVTGQAPQATFADSASVNTWAKEAVNWCSANGMIILDNGNMNPQADATRAEIATMLMVISLLSN